MSKAPRWHFASARDLFESACAASHDAERVRHQLIELRERAGGIGGGSLEPRAHGTPNPHRMQERTNADMDREAALRRRMREDEDLMDLACAVLYGRGGDAGLSSLVPAWWCDVLWWRYLDRASWPRVGQAVGYSEQRCRQVRDLALETVDSWGIVATMDGTPLNDYDTWERDRRREESRKTSGR